MASETIGGRERSNRQACAACKHQRKKCQNDCLLAPYFPAEKTAEFQVVLKFFGVKKIAKILENIPSEFRQEIAESFLWEANMWQQDPVRGPLGFYKTLMNEHLRLKKENERLREVIDNTQQQNAAQATSENGFIGFKGCNFDQVTVAIPKINNIIVHGNCSGSAENSELDYDIDSYTSLLQGLEGNKPEHQSENREGKRLRDDHEVVTSPVINGPFTSFNPSVQGQQRMMNQYSSRHYSTVGSYNPVLYGSEQVARVLDETRGVQVGFSRSFGQVSGGQKGQNVLHPSSIGQAIRPMSQDYGYYYGEPTNGRSGGHISSMGHMAEHVLDGGDGHFGLR